MIFEFLETDDILEIIYKLNQEFCEKSDELCELNLFSFSSDGYCAEVVFLDQQIWSSECSERGFDEEKDEYEDFESYLRRQVNKIIEEISGFKL